MEQLLFPLSPDGPTLEVVIGLDGDAMTALQTASQPIPMPVRVRGMLDTACNVTAIAPWIFQHFGIPSRQHSVTQTAGGSHPVSLYFVSLTIPGIVRGGPMFVQTKLEVINRAKPIPDLDVLVGMDVMNECVTLIDGPGRQFTISF